MSNLKMYKYDWIWEKNIWTNFMNVKKQPNRSYEKIIVFTENNQTYNPQMIEIENRIGIIGKQIKDKDEAYMK